MLHSHRPLLTDSWC